MDQYPERSGHYKLTEEWSVELPSEFKCRIEDEDLVLWQQGMTIWCSVWGIEPEETREEALAWMEEEQAEDAFDVSKTDQNDVLLYRYRLLEETNDYRVASLYCFAFSHSSYIQLGIYLDEETRFEDAQRICESIRFVNHQTMH
ncbi:hypothetical protein [Enterovibrio baiacu]|uniref:hypothetical protein n=1 Tax=Enterovibrio baiacu TaxID=2491023 RepID=UPI001011733B|nr:hypothetical protein [Enterovibrio baiacu]MBE1275414.1 hypothetical protein [Enterovibrio baiacu]